MPETNTALNEGWGDAPIAKVKHPADEKPREIVLPEEIINLQHRPSRPRLPVETPIAAPIVEQRLVSPIVTQPVVEEKYQIRESQPVMAPAAGDVRIRQEVASQRNINLDELLKELLTYSGSDLHLSVGSTPMIRVHGEVRPSPSHKDYILTQNELEIALYSFLTPAQITTYETEWELDTSYTIPNISRFRVNILKQKGNIGAVLRVITDDIKSLEDLGMPSTLYRLASLPRGLVLVTGQTGSGKSTTLASLVDYANKTRAGHIISIEDPIEFVHTSKKSVVNQREVGVDTRSFAEALKHVLRQDPDIILIGELRDLETIKVALSAAETGHLVFATLHTQSAKDTINRIIDVFPGDQQGQIRTQLSTTLRGVICQTLLKKSDGSGRIPALEIMLVNFSIANLIRNDQLQEIPSAISTGKAEGMQTLDQHLASLYSRGVISRETADEYASYAKNLEAYIGKNKPTDAASSLKSTGLAGGSS